MTAPHIVDPAGAPADTPLGDAEFARLLAPAGPFEAAPHLAVAVSGGADSMALGLLAAAWARRRRGRVTALTVDHGLRPESGAEARLVGRWLRQRGIAHRILRWRGDKPKTGVQAAARSARLELLADWCVRHQVLHLLYGHQMEDQAGTLLLRLSAGSGGDGLAAMPLVTDVAVRNLAVPGGTLGVPSVRLLRPLLSVPETRLSATLQAKAQAWVDDPSNQNSSYARARLEAAIGALRREGLTAPRLARTARRAGHDRAALERACGDALAGCVAPHPAGFFQLDWARWRDLPEAISRRVLIRLLANAGAREFGPRLARVERLCAALLGAYPRHAATLGGCRIVPYRGGILICREPGAARDIVTLGPGAARLWDRRFHVSLARGAEYRGDCSVGRLGSEGISRLRRQMADQGAALARIPAPARPALPAFRDLDGVLAVPHLNYTRLTVPRRFAAVFCPVGSVGGGVFGPVA